MRFPRSLRTALGWLYTLLKNPYFWGGIGGLLVVGIAAYLLTDAVIMPSYTRHGVSVRVPNVENRSFLDAKKRVEERGLTVKRQLGRYNPNVPRETVVDQNPPPKADVKPGRRVYLTVNAGDVPMVAIPDLSGISVREAKNRISSLGLRVGTVQVDTIPSPYPNTITRQQPSPKDSLEKGSTIDIWYSTGLGTDTVRVPTVVGRTVKEARSLLLRRKLRAVVVSSQTPSSKDSSPADTTDTRQFVQRQGRAPATEVRTGTEIRLFTTTDSTAVSIPDTTAQDSSAVLD